MPSSSPQAAGEHRLTSVPIPTTSGGFGSPVAEPFTQQALHLAGQAWRGLQYLLLPLLVLSLWWWASRSELLPANILPAPTTVVDAFVQLLASGQLLDHLGISLCRVVQGAALGVTLGLVLGVAMGASARIEGWIGPTFRMLVQIPAIALIPLLMLLLGIDDSLKLFIMAKACSIPLALIVADGIRSLPRAYVETGRVLCLHRGTYLRRVLVAGVLPSAFTGIRQGVAQVWVALVVVEMMASADGIGYLMTWSRQIFQLDVVLVCIAVIGITGFAIDCAMRLIEARLLRGSLNTALPPSGERRFEWHGLTLPALLLFLWWLSTNQQWVSPLVLVPFEQLFAALADEDIRHSLFSGLLSTFSRLLGGAAIGIMLGLLLGLAMGLSRPVERLLGPSFHGFRQVAILAWVPLMTAWFGAGDLCKLVLVAIAALNPMVMGTYEGVRNAPRQLLEAGEVMGFSRHKRLTHIYLPAAAPAVVTAMQLSLIYAWFAAIGAEYVIGVIAGGIGSVVIAAQGQFRTDVVLIGVTLISIVGIGMNKLLRLTQRHLFPWQPSN